MLLDGIHHIAFIARNIDAVRTFYSEVFDADVGPTETHGYKDSETMTRIRIGPHTEFNVFTIDGNPEPDRQTPMWRRGRLDHFGLHAASAESFETIRLRLMQCGASDGKVNDFGSTRSVFFRDPDGLECEILLQTEQ